MAGAGAFEELTMDPPSLMTPKDMAAYMCVSLSMVYSLLQSGKIPAHRIGCRGRGKWLARREDVDGFLASCKVSEIAPPDDGEYKFLHPGR